MATAWSGVLMTVLGIAVVFLGLLVFIGRTRGSRAPGGKENGPLERGNDPLPATGSAPPAASVAQDMPRAYTPGPPIDPGTPKLYAVISGVIARTLEAEGVCAETGFAIRKVRRLTQCEKKLTTKDPALHAVVAASVAAALESEGVDPQTGFVIRSVRAV